jgi:hypothetical protein
MVLAPLRFLLELCLVAGLAVAGASASWWAAVLLPALLAMVWGRFVAPRSRHRLADPLRLAIEIALFAATGLALTIAGHIGAGVVLAATSTAVAFALRRTW